MLTPTPPLTPLATPSLTLLASSTPTLSPTPPLTMIQGTGGQFESGEVGVYKGPSFDAVNVVQRSFLVLLVEVRETFHQL